MEYLSFLFVQSRFVQSFASNLWLYSEQEENGKKEEKRIYAKKSSI